MCGIFAYKGTKTSAGTLILQGLASLEYRGYDSWGVAIKKDDGSVYLEKHTGKIGTATFPEMKASIGIGHTRWATHGGVTEQNAHPHSSVNQDVIIVHNGIVENFEEIKADLISKGYCFVSETDSEVIAHLTAEIKKSTKDLKEVVLQVFHRLEGMNAIIIFFPKEEAFYAIKNGSPIVFGTKPGEMFIASDASALVPHTQHVHYMEDQELLEICEDEYRFYDNTGAPKQVEFMELQYSAEDVNLGNFEHFMLKEIHEQPKVLQYILDTQQEEIHKAAEIIKKAYGTYFIACGPPSTLVLPGPICFQKLRNVM